jgi:hypothetical protein
MDGDREVGRLAVNALARGRVRVLGTNRVPDLVATVARR